MKLGKGSKPRKGGATATPSSQAGSQVKPGLPFNANQKVGWIERDIMSSRRMTPGGTVGKGAPRVKHR
jgi:hypothetical protein